MAFKNPLKNILPKSPRKSAVLGCLLVCVGCAAAQGVSMLEEFSGVHKPGDRVAGHGMALFGQNHYYLAHIPIFSRPHNEQLVMKVQIKDQNGMPLVHDFSSEGYSLNPDMHVSLDDMANSAIVTIGGNIHQGNFEHGGPVVYPDVSVTIEKVLVARNLPGNNEIADGLQEYFLLGDEKEAFLLNYIREKRAFQQILSLNPLGLEKVEGLSPLKAKFVQLMATDRLQGEVKAQFSFPRDPAPIPPSIELSTEKELWCLKGPDFFQSCQ